MKRGGQWSSIRRSSTRESDHQQGDYRYTQHRQRTNMATCLRRQCVDGVLTALQLHTHPPVPLTTADEENYEASLYEEGVVEI